MQDNPTRTIELFCWIVDISYASFPISMEESQTVEDMIEVIFDKKRHLFPKVVNDPGCLIAHRASIKDKGNITHEDVLKDPSVDEEPLPSSRKLSTLFPLDPPEETISIVVKVYDLAGAIPRRLTRLDDDERPAKRTRPSDLFDESNTVLDRGLFHTPSKPVAEVQNSVRQILERYRPTMRMLVMKAGREPLIPPWIPEVGEEAFRTHIKTLAIPEVGGLPSLLLHDLGSETSVMNKRQARHIQSIFSAERHGRLVNTSGSGKTRLGLQGLCQHWGFYAVIEQASDGIGSEDFSRLMSGLNTSRDYDSAKKRGIRDDLAADHMDQKVQHRVLQFVLARFLFLDLLITEASQSEGGLRPSDHRLLWVLLQALPSTLLEKDAFVELADALRLASTEDLEKQIEEKRYNLLSILKANGARRPLYFFLDEMQSAASLRIGEFRSDDRVTPRPLLRPVWHSLLKIFEPEHVSIIFSGTAINLKSVEKVSESGVFKMDPIFTQKDIGAFDDPVTQGQYIKHYLACGESPAENEFLKRAWGWCRGRYRCTAGLIVFVLVTGPHSPHRALNLFVKSSTNFLPTDGNTWCAAEPAFNNYRIQRVKVWHFERLASRQIDDLRYALYQQIVHGFYTLTSIGDKETIQAFIEYGFARTISREVDVIDEPLAITAAWNWLDNKDDLQFTLLDYLLRDVDKHSSRNNGFEMYLAFYFRKVFEEPRILNEVFTFRRDFALRKDLDLSWQAEKFKLVTVSTPTGTDQREIFVVTPSCGPSSNVGLQAKSSDEVLNWISKNEESYAFCFPPESVGPDIFFYIRSEATGRLLLVAVHAKHYKVVNKSTLVEGVLSVTPPFFRKSKDKKALENNSHFFDALNSIEDRIATKAPYPVLRIFASWEGNAKLERTQDVKDSKGRKATKSKATIKSDEDSINVPDDDPHPLAQLHLTNFEDNSRKLAKSSYRRDTEEVVVFAKAERKQSLRRSERIANLTAGAIGMSVDTP